MTSVVRRRFPIFVAVMGLFVLADPSLGQEEQACEQQRPREGVYSQKAREYIERARDEEDPQDKRGYYGYALRQLREGIAAEPDNPNYYLMAGQLSVEVGDYAGADTLWDRAACLWQPYAMRIDGLRTVAWSDYIEQANELLAAGETEAAMDLYVKAYAINDREPHTIFQVASYDVQMAQMAEDDSTRQALMDEARWGFREALAATGRSESLTEEERGEFYWTASTNLAQILAFEGRLLEAAAVLEEFLEMYPDHADARSGLASYLAMHVVALRDSSELVADEAAKESLLTEATAVEERVLEQYRALLSMEGATFEADRYHQMGIGLYELGSYDEAVVAFKQALELEPYRAESLEYVCHALYQAERYDSLLVVAGQLVERYPANGDFLVLLAHAWRGNDDSQRALEVLQLRETLPFQLAPVTLEGGAIFGELRNLGLEPGTSITVAFDFYDSGGNVIGRGTLEMPAPPEQEAVPFRVAPDDGLVPGVTGFTYSVIEPS
ncbi:MAG: tetratricopeptide repeat protein [Gemmatimonadales bacterium]|jgi:tetratricopeptide (TPR) repeat protein